MGKKISTRSFKPDDFNILVVEDSPANLKTLTALLGEEGYHVIPAVSGEVALKAVRKRAPDLILLDIIMPGIDGYDVCRRLKEDQETRDIPVIFISGLYGAEDKVEAFRVGGVDFIHKPFQPEEVLARTRVQLCLRQMQVRLEKQDTQLQLANARQRELAFVKSQFLAM